MINNDKDDKYAAVVYLSEILKYKPENVCLLKVWTDDPNSQFKNKYVMGAIEMLSEMYNIKIIWNFSATSHGEGPVDGRSNIESKLQQTRSADVKA